MACEMDGWTLFFGNLGASVFGAAVGLLIAAIGIWAVRQLLNWGR